MTRELLPANQGTFETWTIHARDAAKTFGSRKKVTNVHGHANANERGCENLCNGLYKRTYNNIAPTARDSTPFPSRVVVVSAPGPCDRVESGAATLPDEGGGGGLSPEVLMLHMANHLAKNRLVRHARAVRLRRAHEAMAEV